MKRIFSKDYLVKELGLPHDEDGTKVEIKENTLVDNDRWSLYFRLTFLLKEDGNYYQAYYSIGATEMQDEEPWQDEDEVECTIVEPTEVVITQYVEKDVMGERRTV